MVGILPDVQPGESIAATGAWKQHSTYGEQFEVTSFEKTLPKSKEAIERGPPVSGAIKGIGAALAKRIVDKFGGGYISGDGAGAGAAGGDQRGSARQAPAR